MNAARNGGGAPGDVIAPLVTARPRSIRRRRCALTSLSGVGAARVIS